MSNTKAEAYYQKENPFREGLTKLRALALETGMEEAYKWNGPVYTIKDKNVLGIHAFTSHFGIWFFHGCFLKDPQKVLENAQEGKTKAMRHWKFTSADEIDPDIVRSYIKEALENQKKGLAWKPDSGKSTEIPELLKKALKADPALRDSFVKFSPYKQREFCEYIATAKQETTKLRRLQKIIPMIHAGVSINDKYRKA